MKRIIASLLGAVVVVVLILYLAFVNYLSAYHVGIAWNRITGELWLQDTGGWKVTPPWVSVSRIDTRPQRVCFTTAGRGFNCRLVRFVPEKYEEFVEVEGFRYYWWANRLSFNLGYEEEYRGMRDIFRGYAFGVRRYSFIEVVDSYATDR